MTQIVINNNSKDSCRRSLEDALQQAKRLETFSDTGNELCQLALTIDGTSLVYILDTELEEQVIVLVTLASGSLSPFSISCMSMVVY